MRTTTFCGRAAHFRSAAGFNIKNLYCTHSGRSLRQVHPSSAIKWCEAVHLTWITERHGNPNKIWF
jgi:hypothetical protein